MNKRKVEAYLPKAIETLSDPKCEIESNGVIKKSLRSNISEFGASITMGSFKATVAAFAKESTDNENRRKLLRALYHIVHNDWKDAKEISQLTIENRVDKKEFINASIALKLALNSFDLNSGGDNNGKA